jgi:hypothetical protein
MRDECRSVTSVGSIALPGMPSRFTIWRSLHLLTWDVARRIATLPARNVDEMTKYGMTGAKSPQPGCKRISPSTSCVETKE